MIVYFFYEPYITFIYFIQDAEKVAIDFQVSAVNVCLVRTFDKLRINQTKVSEVANVNSLTDDVSTLMGSTLAQPPPTLDQIKPVGLLGKGLLMRGDREVELVVLCSQHPTQELLDLVAQSLPAHLKVLLLFPTSIFNF